MADRKKPTSVLLHERNRLRDELYRACSDGRIHDIHKLRVKLKDACEVYDKRIADEQEAARIKEERRKAREAARAARLQEKLEKQRLREEKRKAKELTKQQKGITK